MKRREFLTTAAALSGWPVRFAEADVRHPDFKQPPRVEEIFRDLAQPVHSRLLRDNARRAQAGEADLSAGYALAVDSRAARLATAVADFGSFMSVSMGVTKAGGGYSIECKLGEPRGCPAGAAEAFHLAIEPEHTRVTARDSEGIRRALIYLQDEMVARAGPFLPAGVLSRWAVVEDRITRSPVAPYRWLSGWELEHDRDYYPDEYLNKLAHCGMNGIWVAGLLSRMVASKTLPELGPLEHRLQKLQRLTARAAAYGIRTYLFCIEPRAVPADHPVLAAHPEIRGAEGRALCVSTPIVRQYIRETMRELFTAVPELAGIINIFKGERFTTCWTTDKLAQTCPRCRTRRVGEVLADSLNSFMEGISSASKTAKLVAWGYSGHNATDLTSFLPHLHRDVIWMGNFEHGGEKTVRGRRVQVQEYSLSSVGPSAAYANVAREMKRDGRQYFAKLQLGNTYELSSVPYVPAPRTVHDKLAAMRELGVKGGMMSWIIGGYPSPMLKVAGEASFAPAMNPPDLLRRVAAPWGASRAARVAGAWDHFARAFQLYPCAYQVFYYGPITRAPSYQLHLEREPRRAEPYNWRLTRDRVEQPFEDQVARWLGPFTAGEMSAAFREMADEWDKGVTILEECLRSQSNALELRKQHAVAAAAGIQFRSAANAIEFYSLRGRLVNSEEPSRPPIVRRMREVAEDDIRLAESMKPHLALDPAIGFESEIYDYSYSLETVDAKIRHDRATAATLAQWEKSGVDMAVMQQTLPSPAAARRPAATWKQWLEWGD